MKSTDDAASLTAEASICITPPGTRGVRIPSPILGLFKIGGALLVWMYRRLGSLLSRTEFRMVLLTTRGAKTGRMRTSPLGGFTSAENEWLVVGSNAGSARHPAWLFNMAKHPDDIWLEVGRLRLKVRAKTLEGPERSEALARIAAIAPPYSNYQTKTDREIPILRLTREPE